MFAKMETYMERRKFLFSLASLPLIPKLLEFKQLDWDLRFEKHHDPDAFIPDTFKVIKGPYEYKSSYTVGFDFRDSNGESAALEIANIIVAELEYGFEGMTQLFDLERAHGCDPAIREKLENKLRRVKITQIEYNKIVLFIHKLRCKYNCPKSDWWEKYEKALNKICESWS